MGGSLLIHWGNRAAGTAGVRSGAVLEAPAFVAGLDDLAMMGETVEQRGGHLEYFAVIERDGRSRINSILRVVPRPFKISGTDQARCVVTQSNSRRAPSAANVRFGSKADLRPSHQECPLSGAKQTLFSTTLGSSIIRPFSLRKEKDHVHLREKDR